MAANRTDHPLERLVFFSDAVFAIAITLLVIEIHQPDNVGDGAGATLEALARLLPSFIGYAVSFAVIGAFWAGHHRAFCMAARLGPGIIFWNLMLLGAIAFMPFVTSFMSGNYAKTAPSAVYWGWMLLTALLNLRVNSLATGPAMRAANVTAEAAADVPRRSRAVALAALTALALSQLKPWLGPAGMATIPLWLLILRKLAKAPAAA